MRGFMPTDPQTPLGPPERPTEPSERRNWRPIPGRPNWFWDTHNQERYVEPPRKETL